MTAGLGGRRRRARIVRGAVYAVSLGAVAALARAVNWSRIFDALFDVSLIPELFPDILTRAARNTLIFTGLGFALGLVLGLVLAFMRLSGIRPYRWFAAVYIEVFRGIPALLTIILIGFGIPVATGFRLPGTYTAGSVAIGIVSSAYMAETIRAGIQAVPRGQMEAARSLGMTYPQSMASIVIPQAFRIIIPPMVNELILLLKDTSLISVLGVTDATRELTRFGRDFVNLRANATPLVVAGLVYLAMTVPLTRIAALLERRAGRSR